MRRRTVAVVVVLVVLCCVATALGAFAYLLWPRGLVRPVVLIESPSYGERVAVGETVTIHAVARGDAEVTRVELWVDGQLQESQSSTIPGGISPFPLVAQWRPLSPGTHRMTARAFNIRGARAHASINVEAIAEADADADEVADEDDACPDERGWSASAGCPDLDYDGIPDADDVCPDEAGLPGGDGCPAPSERDGDGDGVVDEVDACPDAAGAPVSEGCPDADGDRVGDADDACPSEPGWPENDGCLVEGDLDFDGIPDEEDDCPEEWGLPEHSGCADDDGDGIPDREDACLDEVGLPERAGCPDRDGDGVADGDDLWPEEPGLPEDHGAPHTGAPDSDGDGVPDDIDECDEEEGLPEHFGCPPPGAAEDADGDGIADDEEGPVGALDGFFFVPGVFEIVQRVSTPVPKAAIPIEFQAVEFTVGHQPYDGIACYVHLGTMDPLLPGSLDPFAGRWSLDPIGRTRQWNVADYMGSVITTFEESGRFPVYVECEAWVETTVCSGEGGLCIPETIEIDLGYFRGGSTDDPWSDPSSMGYPPQERDGHVITERSEYGDPGHWFEMSFRICDYSCEEVMFQPPVIRLVERGVDTRLEWTWHGDRRSITAFNVYYFGNRHFSVDRRDNWVSIQDYAVDCGTIQEFQMTVEAGGRESPLSNTVLWHPPRPCELMLKVEFDTLRTFWLGGPDERRDFSRGPIHGNFWVTSGGRTERLEFDAVHERNWWNWVTSGYRLGHFETYSIAHIFDWIWRRMNCMGACPQYSVSAGGRNYVLVDWPPEDDLSFGGTIWDFDDDNADDILFDAQHTIPAEEVEEVVRGLQSAYGFINLEDRNIAVWVRLGFEGV